MSAVPIITAKKSSATGLAFLNKNHALLLQWGGGGGGDIHKHLNIPVQLKLPGVLVQTASVLQLSASVAHSSISEIKMLHYHNKLSLTCRSFWYRKTMLYTPYRNSIVGRHRNRAICCQIIATYMAVVWHNLTT